jgi:hypothetical protein
MLRRVCLISLVLFASCYHGLKVTSCIVDPANSGFQCMGPDDKVGYFRTYAQGSDLLCCSPKDMESFLKSCNTKNLFTPTICSVDTHSSGGFICTAMDGGTAPVPFERMSNFYCLSPKDRGRLIDRCQP